MRKDLELLFLKYFRAGKDERAAKVLSILKQRFNTTAFELANKYNLLDEE